MKRVAIFHPVDDKYGASNILAFVLSFLSEEYVCDVYIPKLTGEIASTLSGVLNNDCSRVNFIEMPELPIVHRKMYSISGVIGWSIKNIKVLITLNKIKKNYDFFYINTLALFSLAFICRLSNIKVLVHCHECLDGSTYGNIIKRVVKSCATIIVCVSHCVERYMGKGLNVYVVHNGIPDIDNSMLERCNIASRNKIAFAMVGRVMPEKGQWFLCDAVKKIPANKRNAMEIHVFGDAPPTRSHLFNEFKKLIKDNSLDNVFVLHGFEPNVSSKISSMDVCLIPSIMADPFPTTVLEGLMAGKVVVTTNNGGASEIISNGVNGYIVEPGDSQELANTLVRILDKTDDERAFIQNNARMSYETEFTLSRFKRRFSTVLHIFKDKY